MGNLSLIIDFCYCVVIQKVVMHIKHSTYIIILYINMYSDNIHIFKIFKIILSNLYVKNVRIFLSFLHIYVFGLYTNFYFLTDFRNALHILLP